jgi:ABC-type Fe3+-siderophore transport system permease subunit
MTTLTRTWWGRVAVAAGAVVLGLLAAVFIVPSERAKEWLFMAAFLVAAVAVAGAAAAQLRQRHERPTVLPRTRLGWWALGLALAGVLLTVATPAVITALRPDAAEPLVAMVYPAVLGLASGLAAGVTAAVAWFRRAERSLLVLLTMVPALLAVAFVVGEFVFPH